MSISTGTARSVVARREDVAGALSLLPAAAAVKPCLSLHSTPEDLYTSECVLCLGPLKLPMTNTWAGLVPPTKAVDRKHTSSRDCGLRLD